MNAENKKVGFHTLGCKLNFAETAYIARNLTENGYQKVPFSSFANIYIINTCSVTENADRECKTLVRKALKQNENAFVVVVGCYAQLKPEEISKIEGVSLVLGAAEKFNIVKYLLNIEKQDTCQMHSCEIEEVNQFVGSYSVGDRTRAFLKVQDGCDYVCTYCTIPLARGISRSDSLENVVKNAKNILAKDIKEIVLTGVNVGDYGKGEFGNKKHEHTFLELLQNLELLEDLKRLRISSIEPNLITSNIIELVARSQKLVPHFHIPLQSGSDVLLKKMKRRYLTELYKNKITLIKSLMPNACIGVDVIVGFPGETEEEFIKTYNFIKELPISYLHVFTYSERDNTEATLLDGVIAIKERKERNKRLTILSQKKQFEFYESQKNNSYSVLFENENKNGFIYGFTENYIRVKMPWQKDKENTIVKIKLAEIDTSEMVYLTDFVGC
ncbi:MAG: tRNA (N(6)-L-threonylcarbamoyladenosine(37)-C(2))-methylthiotransferase MtaB [Solirubrobacteraceae bacterium]